MRVLKKKHCLQPRLVFANYYLHLYDRINLGFCGRFTPAEAMSLVCSAALVMVWIVTGHWVLMDGMFTQFIHVANKNYR